MGNNNDKNKSKLEKQDDYSKTWLAIVIPVSIAVFGCSELVFGIIKKLYQQSNAIIPVLIILIAFSIFCFGTALWINQDNIRRKGKQISEHQVFERKSRWNTTGTFLFFFW